MGFYPALPSPQAKPRAKGLKACLRALVRLGQAHHPGYTGGMPRSTKPKPKEEAPFLITPPRKKGGLPFLNR